MQYDFDENLYVAFICLYKTLLVPVRMLVSLKVHRYNVSIDNSIALSLWQGKENCCYNFIYIYEYSKIGTVIPIDGV